MAGICSRIAAWAAVRAGGNRPDHAVKDSVQKRVHQAARTGRFFFASGVVKRNPAAHSTALSISSGKKKIVRLAIITY